MFNQITDNFIRIPNVIVNDFQISPTSKYLYAWIWNWSYHGEFSKSIEDIAIILRCSIPTARKHLKELKTKEYIKIEIIEGNKRLITPLINDSIELQEKRRAEQEQINYNKRLLGMVKEQPEAVKKFIKDIR